jgi:hypothetical protein
MVCLVQRVFAATHGFAVDVHGFARAVALTGEDKMEDGVTR